MAKVEAYTNSAEEMQRFELLRILRILGNERRLRILCRFCLSKSGELDVSQLAAQIGLSQSALSQHLAKMRGCGLVAVRQSGNRRFYRIGGSARPWRLLAALCTYVSTR